MLVVRSEFVKVFLAVAALVPAIGVVRSGSSSRIEWAELPPEIGEKSENVRFGWLVVPEDREAGSGRELRLPFVILKCQGPAPRPDPVLFMSGGPGGGSVSGFRGRLRHPILEKRDLILLDQRGTGHSRPSLAAPEIDAVLRESIGGNLNNAVDSQRYRAALEACLSRFQREGVNLKAYTTTNSAADVADLRRLLGLREWNLYGISYSTKLMLTVLRDHPEGIRSIILDSPLPLQANWDVEAAGNVLSRLDALFQSVSRAHPGLKARTLELIKRADRAPLTVSVPDPYTNSPAVIRLTGFGVMDALYAGLEDTALIPRIPGLLERACSGDVQHGLAPLVAAMIQVPSYAWGMRFAVWMNEEVPFEDLVRTSRVTKGWPASLAKWRPANMPPEVLALWPKGKPDPIENVAVTSDVPVLIASGELDPDTPPDYAKETARTLRRSKVISFPGFSHLPLFRHPGGAGIIVDFLDCPDASDHPL
jgi:pimeloyl-ACP methyl ester carboxylesterase